MAVTNGETAGWLDQCLSEALPGARLIGELGRGAQSAVYRIERDGMAYALKVLSDPMSDAAPLRREAALIAWIGHPGLPNVYAVGEVGGRPYLVMELIDGSDLAALIRRGALPAEQTVEVGRQVATALSAMHAAGVAHRDVKPANIVVQDRGTVRLIDLGLVVRGGGEAGRIEAAGTPEYAAPEQSGMLKRPVDARSDLYSLGVVLFECLTGMPPYRADDVGELLRLHAAAPVPDPRSGSPETPPELAAVVMRLLAKDPDDRFPDAAHVVAALNELGAGPEHQAGDDQVPLGGREQQYAKLTGAWRRTGAGSGCVASVRGGTGSGKTRLLLELAGRARGDQRPVLAARCTAGATPLEALRVAVDDYAGWVSRLPGEAGSTARLRLRSAAGEDAALLGRLSTTLAELLTAVPAATADHDLFGEVVVGFLSSLATAHGGLLLSFDDADHLDEGSRAVLRRMVPRLRDLPILVLLSGTAEEVPADLTVDLDPLDAETRAQVIRALARGTGAGDLLVSHLAGRGAGTPLEIREYLTAIVDAGLLTRQWGRWELDTEALDRLDLPDDVIGLITRRLGEVSAATRDLLATAATIGMVFPPNLAATATGLRHEEASFLFDEAHTAGVVQTCEERLGFTHDRLRTAILADLTGDQLRRRHARIAEVMCAGLDGAMPDDPAVIYGLAGHYVEGEPDGDPASSLATMVAAGRLALSDGAPAQAIVFLDAAAALADRHPELAAARFESRKLLGEALHAAGQFGEAIEAYQRALDAAPDAVDRAAIHTEIAEVHQSRLDFTGELAALTQGLAELGHPLPATRWWLVLGSMAYFLAGVGVAVTEIGFGAARDERRRRYDLRAQLYRAVCNCGSGSMDQLMSTSGMLRMLYPAARVGRCEEYALALAYINGLLGLIGLRRYHGLYTRAIAVADHLADARLRARLRYIRLIIEDMIGSRDDGAALVRLAQQDRHLPLTEYLSSYYIRCGYLLLRGHVREARQLWKTARTRQAPEDFNDHYFALMDVILDAKCGALVNADLTWQRATADPLPATSMAQLGRLSVAVHLAVEHRAGGEFGRAAADLTEFPTAPRTTPALHRSVYVALAQGHIEQCCLGTGTLRAAEEAVATLGKIAKHPALAAHHAVASAYLHHLRGNHDRALDALNRSDRMLRSSDTPLAEYEAARLRARALHALGRHAQAVAQARAALSLADTHGWPHRAAWLHAEFSGLGRPTIGPTATSMAARNSATYHPFVRRVEALEQISLAASRVLDPAQLTRIALDEAVRLFGADRAFLFLTEPGDEARLNPHLGRDSTGADVETITGYGSTLVESVRASGQPLVVTGTDQGAALGSESAVLHGLRSIMVAPMQLDGRLLGVIYLDSRLAKGMFTTDDVATLTAITAHVAAALETARAAQLAVAVHAAEQQRDTAETIRRALADVTGTLDPGEVLHRLVATLTATLPADECRLVLCTDGKLELSDPTGSRTAAEVITVDDPALAPLLHARAPLRGGENDLSILGDRIASWLAVPLHTRDGTVGLLVLGSTDGDGYRQEHADLAHALTGQGMVAYENARLFTRVQELATLDELTGVPNRRHFFTLGHREIDVARRRRSDLAIAMIDIDHFKSVNDNHGHHVGDQVIQEVARRLRDTARATDIVGRYGGEEFAIVLADLKDHAFAAAERLRRAVADTPIMTDSGPLPVTISVGMAELTPRMEDLETLLSSADHALYVAKRSGRNAVSMSDHA